MQPTAREVGAMWWASRRAVLAAGVAGATMRLGRVMMVLAAAAAVAAPASAAAAGARAAGLAVPGSTWGRAFEVPWSGALNSAVQAEVSSVSCASAGNCAAGGHYEDDAGRRQGFVASERNGRWGQAIEVPGSGALNTGGYARVLSVSCPSAGNCTAGGVYAGAHGDQAFVVSERNGRWGQAIEVPGSGALNTGGAARVWSVSCASAGNCAAGGTYGVIAGGFFHAQALVASERNGRWGRAIEVPGSGALNTGGDAVVWSVSCPSAANCAAGGSLSRQGFVASERNGRWGRAIEVPGTLNTVGPALVTSVSCP